MSISKYLLENDFKMVLADNYIDILNYQEVSLFDDNRIIIKNKNGIITIFGNNLIISKWMDNEILVSGEVIKIELR
jgi:sporulation protein YqfC